jgi:hypothetical protein
MSFINSCLSFGVNCQFVVYVIQHCGNGFGLGEGGAIEAQIFNFAQKLNRRTAVELCSFAPLLQSTLVIGFLSSHQFKQQRI